MDVDRGKDAGIPYFSPEERAKLVREISAEKYRFLAGKEFFSINPKKFSEDCPYPRGITVYGDKGWLEKGRLEKNINFAIEIEKEGFDEVAKKKLYTPLTEEYLFYQDGHVMKTVYNDQNPAIEHHEAGKEELERLVKTMEQVNSRKEDSFLSGITKFDDS
ncbi:MAG: hypothetical protein HW400_123 [Candidatus Levybacteria bacterium]|nr:hypothetical protein [Candidatus Levybacteria bacterium]